MERENRGGSISGGNIEGDEENQTSSRSPVEVVEESERKSKDIDDR